MDKANWSTKLNELKVVRDAATGAFSVSFPLYDAGSKVGTIILSMTDTRQFGCVVEQPVSADPLDFSGPTGIRVV